MHYKVLNNSNIQFFDDGDNYFFGTDYRSLV